MQVRLLQTGCFCIINLPVFKCHLLNQSAALKLCGSFEKHEKFMVKVWELECRAQTPFMQFKHVSVFFLFLGQSLCGAVVPVRDLKPLITGNYLFMLVYFFSPPGLAAAIEALYVA